MSLETCSNDGVPTIIGTTIVANWVITLLQLVSAVFTCYHIIDWIQEKFLGSSDPHAHMPLSLKIKYC